MLVFGSCWNKVLDLLFVCWVRGSGDYDWKKKRYSRLSSLANVCIFVQVVLRPEKKKFQSSPERLRPENKKVQVVIKFVLVQLEL